MIFGAPEPSISIPDSALTPFLLERADRRGDRVAFVDGPSGRTLTHGGWAHAVRRAAGGLARRGFGKGDVLGIFSPNLPEYAIAFHAASLLGGAVTTANPLNTVDELGRQLRDSRAKLLVTVPPLLDKAQEAARQGGIPEVFVFGEAAGATPFAALVGADEAAPVTVDARQHVVALPYSSGTTGLPKGVMLTHHNIVANVLQSSVALHLDESDVMLGVLPFFHIYGMVVIMNLGLYNGARIVTMPRFDLEPCLSLIQAQKVTFAALVPPIILALAKHPVVEQYDLKSLHTVFSGAAPLGENVARAAAARIGCRVIQGYGLTETSPVTHATRATNPNPRLAGIGPLVPNTEGKIVDVETGAEKEPNQEGEICVRGPQVMKGYLGQPEATAAMIDADGWLHTGDVGYADADGCFFVVDRVKELIKYKGMQVPPAELEAVLLSHPAVADAAVVPVAHEESGQVPKAFVVLRTPVGAEELMDYVAQRVAPYKKIRSVEVIDQIPRSAAGKILRRLLRDRSQ